MHCVLAAAGVAVIHDVRKKRDGGLADLPEGIAREHDVPHVLGLERVEQQGHALLERGARLFGDRGVAVLRSLKKPLDVPFGGELLDVRFEERHLVRLPVAGG